MSDITVSGAPGRDVPYEIVVAMENALKASAQPGGSPYDSDEDRYELGLAVSYFLDTPGVAEWLSERIAPPARACG